ncbi:hypothetical protein D3C76_1825330 [compost metagenome]
MLLVLQPLDPIHIMADVDIQSAVVQKRAFTAAGDAHRRGCFELGESVAQFRLQAVELWSLHF